MEQYQNAVQRVDAAMQRLNTTLASYRLSQKTTNGHDGPISAASSPPTTSSRAQRQPTPAELSGPHAQAWSQMLWLRVEDAIPEILDEQWSEWLDLVPHIYSLLEDHPYCSPLYILLSRKFLQLGYPDLAAGAAYKALLLSDAIRDSSDEYHDMACEALSRVVSHQPLTHRITLLKDELVTGMATHEDRIPDFADDQDLEIGVWLRTHYLPAAYIVLVRGLIACGCLRSAHDYSCQAKALYPDNEDIKAEDRKIRGLVAKHFGVGESKIPTSGLQTIPDEGYVRREAYPWNHHEPNRYNELPKLNRMMSRVAPKLEIRAVELPLLTNPGSDDENHGATTTQLGVFAKEDIAPGEVILEETSILTANNRLQDALCDACSAALPPANASDPAVSCDDCETVFCSEDCALRALDTYHEALCGADVEAIARDVAPDQAANALYALLLLRVFAIASQKHLHPLDVDEVQYIWGDFHHLATTKGRVNRHAHPKADPHGNDQDEGQDESGKAFAYFPVTLPFSFEYNIRLPLHMLEKMGLDIFDDAAHHDVWVINTLYAKFRGTASARLSGRGGRGEEDGASGVNATGKGNTKEGQGIRLTRRRGPEVGAVHPMWCMANHSCDPAVSWEWGGSIKFTARTERAQWRRPKMSEEGGEGGGGGDEEETLDRAFAGIRKDEEVFNHYCDIDLPVRERREWARGALGGDCRCPRCSWESHEVH